MKKEKKKVNKEFQSTHIKKFIRDFNKSYNLENLFINPKLLRKFRKKENHLQFFLKYIIIPTIIILCLSGYYRGADISFFAYTLSIVFIPILLFVFYFYFIFLPQAKKDIKSESRNPFSYWATDEHRTKRIKMIAKGYSPKQRQELCRLAQLEYEMEVANSKPIGIIGVLLSFLSFLVAVVISLEIPKDWLIEYYNSCYCTINIGQKIGFIVHIVIIMVLFLVIYFFTSIIIRRFYKDKQVLYKKFMEDLIWADYYDKD